jgi:hypothetical protein
VFVNVVFTVTDVTHAPNSAKVNGLHRFIIEKRLCYRNVTKV